MIVPKCSFNDGIIPDLGDILRIVYDEIDQFSFYGFHMDKNSMEYGSCVHARLVSMGLSGNQNTKDSLQLKDSIIDSSMKKLLFPGRGDKSCLIQKFNFTEIWLNDILKPCTRIAFKESTDPEGLLKYLVSIDLLHRQPGYFPGFLAKFRELNPTHPV